MNKLISIVVSLFLLVGCKMPGANPSPGLSLIFSDFFDDNTKGWTSIHNDSTDIKILANQYQFNLTGKSGKSGWVTWKTVDVDSLVNFRIEADFVYIKGDTLSPFGLVYGLGDANNYNFFGIEGSGGYIIGKHNAGVFTPIVNWNQVDLNAGYNKLRIENNGGDYYYSINNVVLQKLPSHHFKGRTVGFYCAGNVSMAVDNLKVSTAPFTK